MLLSNRDTGDRMIACSFSRLGEAESFALRKSCRSRPAPALDTGPEESERRLAWRREIGPAPLP